MRSRDVTSSAIRLQRAVHALQTHFDEDPTSEDINTAMLELRLATIEHADIVADLLDMSMDVFGDLGPVRRIPGIFGALFERGHEMRDQARRGELDGRDIDELVAIVNDLLAAERHWLSQCGTIFFPAEVS